MKFFRLDMFLRFALFCLVVSLFHTIAILGVTHDTTPFDQSVSRRGSVLVTTASELFRHPSSLPCSFSSAIVPSENETAFSNCSSFSSLFPYAEDPFSSGAVGELFIDLAVRSLSHKKVLPFGLESPIPSRYLPSEFTRRNRLNSSEDDFFRHFRYPHMYISLKDLMEHKSGIRDPRFLPELECMSSSSARVGKVSFYELSLCGNETPVSIFTTSTDHVPFLEFFLDSLLNEEEESQSKNMSSLPSPFFAQTSETKNFVNSSFPFFFSRTNIALSHFILERILEELQQNAVLQLHNESTSTSSTPTKWMLVDYLAKEFFGPLNMSNTFFVEVNKWDSRTLNSLSCENVSLVTTKKSYSSSLSHHDLLCQNFSYHFSSIGVGKSISTAYASDYMLYTTREDFNILTREVLLPFGLLNEISERYSALFPVSLSSVPLFLEKPQRKSKDGDGEDFSFCLLNKSLVAPLSSVNKSGKALENTSDQPNYPCEPSSSAPSAHSTSSNYIWVVVGVVSVIAASAFVSYVVDHIIHPTPPTQLLLPEPDRGFNQRQSFSTHSSSTSLSGSLSSSISHSFSNANERRISTGSDMGVRGRAMGFHGNRSVANYRDRALAEEPIFHSSLSREPSLDEIRSVPFSSSFSLTHPENTNAEDPVYLNMYSK